VKFRPFQQAPVLIAVGVIAVVCFASLARLDFFDRLERMTYDWRARLALRHPPTVATNLGFVSISDESIAALNNGSLDFRFGLYWPRQIYGRVLREMTAQGAEAVAFDVLFAGRRFDHAPVSVSATRWPDLPAFLTQLHPGQSPETYENDGQTLTFVESDEYFAWQLARSGVGVIAAERGLLPHALFTDHALTLGDIAADADPDGVLRRARAFQDYRRWHPAFKQVGADKEYGVDLNQVRLEPGRIILQRSGLPDITVPVDASNNFKLSDFSKTLPPGASPTAKAFEIQRVWHMGIVLAARALKINLAEAEVDLPRGRITLRGASGIKRILPVDRDGYFYVNWEITPTNSSLTAESFESLLKQDQLRSAGETNDLVNRWQNKLVVIGSKATGNDLTDRGATPLEKNTLLVSKHWNVANSVITGRFIQPVSMPLELGLIVLLGVMTALLTWQLRVLPGLLGVLALAVSYSLLCVLLFTQHRFWLPMVLPMAGALFVQYGLLVTYRVVFEQREQRRVKSVFSKIVAPDVVNELLEAETLSLGGARREVTVMFADVRGFTEITDRLQEVTAEHIRQHQLSGRAAEACYEEIARQTLQTISLYLGFIADIVKKHGGTLDKYIGDCTMAFWGAPKPNPQHALGCVRAAIEAQRGIHDLNERRVAENAALEIENKARVSAGLPPKPLLPVLALGTGINSGAVMVGLMGSDAHGLNYTVLGREVNLASRLETLSGRGRIIIGETTYEQIRLADPNLAATCIEQEPATPKGFQKPVRNFEVSWRNANNSAQLPKSGAVQK
jgi:class 3 adenylate cyclase/CHASE2 domain-containing sensor protein